MPVHDWTRVPDGTFHHFHVAWIPLIADVLNEGVLPRGYYAMAGQRAIDQFVYQATSALLDGLHLLLIDLHLPTSRDPEGIHGAIWAPLSGQEDYRRPANKPLTLAAYSAWWVDTPIAAFVEPLAVGDSLPPMPLFLEVDRHVLVPLEASYLSAVSKIPQRARRPLES